MHRPWPLLGALVLALAGCPSAEPEPEPEPTPQPAPAGPLAEDVALSLITVNQGVAVPLMSEGLTVDDGAPIVVGRPGLLRVFVAPGEDFAPRDLVAELVLDHVDEVEIRRETIEVEEASLSSDLDSTFVFALDEEDVRANTRFSVAIREVDGTPGLETDGPTWPPVLGDSEPSVELDEAYSLGRADLRASDWGGVVRVYVIPVRYDTDGSGRLPDTSPDQMELLRSWMQRLYPVRDVLIEVGEPHPTTLPFDSTSEPMSDLLEEVISIRSERGIPFDTYAYAMVNPAESRAEYCSSGCTAGIAYRVRNPNTARLRSGVGLGYSGTNTAETMAHEVGHNHDRGHAPCGGAGNVDQAYPYSNGGTGVWGWDIVDEVLIDPTDHADVMGYCTPRWISDYQYGALWSRTAAVEGLASWEGDASAKWQLVSVRPGDRSRVRGVVDFAAPPEGETVLVRLLDGFGAEVGKVAGTALPIEDAGPGVSTLFVPALDDSVATLELPDGRRIRR
ncbi:MAG: hypothetical protein KDA24_28695 [Deltaproteobacteria bacterium]|nr:hypothetical protein [Deltaproteobacteria bacterium]